MFSSHSSRLLTQLTSPAVFDTVRGRWSASTKGAIVSTTPEPVARQKPHGTVAEISFSADQQKTLESATGLKGLTGLYLVELDSIDRARLSPGLVRATMAVMCW